MFYRPSRRTRVAWIGELGRRSHRCSSSANALAPTPGGSGDRLTQRSSVLRPEYPTEVAIADLTGIDPARVRELEDVENVRFVAERPRSMALQEQARRSMPRGVPMAWMDDLCEHPPVWVTHGDGAGFTDVDGHTCLDMYVADMSAFCGHAPGPVVDAVTDRVNLGNQFQLPGEDAIAVAEHLAERRAGRGSRLGPARCVGGSSPRW